jgi:hypothetical protein
VAQRVQLAARRRLQQLREGHLHETAAAAATVVGGCALCNLQRALAGFGVERWAQQALREAGVARLGTRSTDRKPRRPKSEG